VPYYLSPHLRNKRYEYNTLGPQALDQVSLVRTPESCLINGTNPEPISGILGTAYSLVRRKHAVDSTVTGQFVGVSDFGAADRS
jgi:hypothetical protein